ncbi:MAG: hypothetical protein ACR2J8_13495, partial [Thermomicrobiales bacterium]
MDQERFDGIARALGSAATRRGTLAGLLASGLAARLATGLDARPGGRGGNGGNGGGKCRRTKKKCRENRECCSGFCRPGNKPELGRCACLTGGKPCSAKQKCCSGLTCIDGRCKRYLVATGDACKPSDVCASKAATCVSPTVGCPGTRCLVPLGQSCEEDTDCQSGACVEGVCASCSCPACLTTCTPTVCDTCTYQSVQDAIDAAADGDVIDIASGTYNGSFTIDDKSLTLRGCTAGGPVILKNDSYSNRTLYINSSKSNPVDVDLIDITIKGYWSDPDDTYGGGVIIYGGTLDLCGATAIDDNTAA